MDWLYRLTAPLQQRAWRKAADDRPTTLAWPGWEKARRIGIVFDARAEEGYLESLRQVVSALQGQQRAVALIGWTGEMRPKNALYSGRQLIFTDDFAWNGGVQGGNALEFMQSEFDLVVALHRSEDSPIDYLVARTPAGLRVSLTGANDFYDVRYHSADRLPMDYFRALSAWLAKIPSR
ncbi:MAG: hypothetical protein LW601_01230 [Cryomorphaceae bacterium]|jgi:hypothetical protein|nr:hypothetical protein [Cryomorphaceae bacterium]